MRILFLHKNAESLGIEYLSAVIKRNNHDCMLLFDPGRGEVEFPILNRVRLFTERTVDAFIMDYKPDLILFSLINNLLPWVTKWATYIKKKFNLPIGIGGVYPTVFPEYIISKEFVDFICIGEGEGAIEEIVNRFNGKLVLNGIRNIWYKSVDENGKIVVIKNEMQPLVSDLDTLPMPDKRLFFDYGVFKVRYYLMTSRGCPNSCTFCINHQLKCIYKGLGQYLRRRTPKNVIDELIWAKSEFKYKEIYFYDDIFGSDINWLKEFKDLLFQNNLKIKYKCLMHPNFINTESVRLLRDTGCIDVDMGVESGSERIRKNVFHRTMTNRKMKEAVSLLKNAGIRVSTLNILGNPQEEYEDIIQTIKLNLDLKPSGMLFNVLYPFPKTLIYELCKNENMIDDEADHLIHEGYSSYRNKSLLKLKNWELIERLQIIVPILNKAPMFMWGFLLKIPPILLFRILSIPFLTSFHNARLKIYEFLIMVKKSYKKIRQIEAGRI